jgi:hypothetical protein
MALATLPRRHRERRGDRRPRRQPATDRSQQCGVSCRRAHATQRLRRSRPDLAAAGVGGGCCEAFCRRDGRWAEAEECQSHRQSHGAVAVLSRRPCVALCVCAHLQTLRCWELLKARACVYARVYACVCVCVYVWWWRTAGSWRQGQLKAAGHSLKLYEQSSRCAATLAAIEPRPHGKGGPEVAESLCCGCPHSRDGIACACNEPPK